MASGEAATSSKPGKTSTAEQSSTHLYPDWSAMQAYYGSGVAIPPPYFPPNGPPGHSPHPYMWPSPIMMPPPFGAPYPLYQHAGLYAQPAEGNGEPKNGGVVTAIKPCNNKDSSGPNGLSASARNGDANEFGCIAVLADATSLSESDGKDSDNGTKKKNGNKSPGIVTKENGMMIAAAVNPKLAIQVHAEEGESKIEKRKQSNRESARRSRLRKQAETEELALKVELLVAENQALKSEVNQLTQESARLLLENSGLQEKLKEAQLDADSGKSDSEVTENLLSRIRREN